MAGTEDVDVRRGEQASSTERRSRSFMIARLALRRVVRYAAAEPSGADRSHRSR
jgi:hypothetical protein